MITESEPHGTIKRPAATLSALAALLVAVAIGSGLLGVRFGRRYEYNGQCCEIPRFRKVVVTATEVLGLAAFPSQIGQDKWVSETVFPGVTDGFFLDVGSADGTIGSNTKALEKKGWKGICIDPFPKHMEDRTCQVFKDVVFSEAGKKIQFQMSGDLGGIADTLGTWKEAAMKAATVELTTVTLGDILKRANAPRFIHFMSLDIEGAEFEALKGVPFDVYRFGAFAIEHNDEEPKRSQIQALLRGHGYERVHTWLQDDFYLPQTR